MQRVIIASLCIVALAGGEDAPAAWPCWRGPTGSGAAVDHPGEVKRDPSTWRVLWKSPGTIAMTTGGVSSRCDTQIVGSCSSVVMDAGKVFVFHGWPSETEYQAHVVEGKKAWAMDPASPEVKRKMSSPLWPEGYTAKQWVKAKANVYGDDVMHCFDAGTGETLWRTAVPGGINFQLGSYGPHFTPCAGDGRAYALGTTYRIIAFDAANGEVVWINDEQPGAVKAIAERDARIKNANQKGALRSNYELVTYADLPGGGGVVAYKDGRKGAVIGLDAATGKKLWNAKGGWNIIRWECEGKPYFIAQGTCIDAATGAVKWTTNGCGKAGTKLAVAGEYLVADLTCFKVDGDKAEKHWSLDDLKQAGGEFSPVIHRGRYYTFAQEAGEVNKAHNRKRLICVDLASGEILATCLVGKDGSRGTDGCSSMFAANGLVCYRGADKGHAGTIEVLDADPANFRHLGAFTPPRYACAHTPAMAGGRIWLRGIQHVYCVDLRAE